MLRYRADCDYCCDVRCVIDYVDQVSQVRMTTDDNHLVSHWHWRAPASATVVSALSWHLHQLERRSLELIPSTTAQQSQQHVNALKPIVQITQKWKNLIILMKDQMNKLQTFSAIATFVLRTLLSIIRRCPCTSAPVEHLYFSIDGLFLTPCRNNSVCWCSRQIRLSWMCNTWLYHLHNAFVSFRLLKSCSTNARLRQYTV